MNSNQPLISVLLPTYNCELYILDAVNSILNQTYTNFEFIIIDDCSTDSTVDIIKSLKDDRINLIVKPKNSGYTNSLNYGLTIAKGKYIARMDGDDISLPERFEKQVQILEQDEDIVVCGTIFRIIDSETIITNPETNDDIKIGLLKDSSIGHPTAMIRKHTLGQHNIAYDSKMEPAEDYDLWVKLSAVGKLYNIQEVLFLYRVHDNQVSITRKEKQRQSASKSRFNMLNQLGFQYTEAEKHAYIKQFSFTERLNFEELLVLVKLKGKLLNSNSEAFFDKHKLKIILDAYEKENVNQYFKANNKYSFKMIKEFRHISNQITIDFTFFEKIKLLIKCAVFKNIK